MHRVKHMNTTQIGFALPCFHMPSTPQLNTNTHDLIQIDSLLSYTHERTDYFTPSLCQTNTLPLYNPNTKYQTKIVFTFVSLVKK